ncbi:bifunctional DNA primase/polymerase [Acetobacter malorum]|uniref:hypothetical protein n=1 Tax=Acetobacter malorum TaxID=178901 RepID=UPI0035714F18
MDGRTIRVSEEHDLANKLPTAPFLDACVKQCASMNVACVLGPATSNVVVIDVDITDVAMSIAVQRIAFEIFGITPFRRVGRPPKMALFYRHAQEDPVASISRFFSAKNEKGEEIKSGQGVEILSTGKSVTLYGRHHGTGRYFTWTGEKDPITSSPSEAPVVTSEQIQTFLERVDEKYPFHKGVDSASSFEMVQTNGRRLYKPSAPGGGTSWVENSDGLIIDGREAYLQSLAFAACRSHAEDINRSAPNIHDVICSEILESFTETVKPENGGRWHGNSLKKEISTRVQRLIRSVASGKVVLRAPRAGGLKASASSHILPSTKWSEADDLAFMMPTSSRRQNLAIKKDKPPTPEDEANNALVADRHLITDGIKEGIQAGLTAFLTDVYGHPTDYAPELRRIRINILRAPTGAGKTSQTVRRLAMDPRTHIPFRPGHLSSPEEVGDDKKKELMCPWVMLLPTYSNIDELRTRAEILNLDGSLPDNELAAQAVEIGLLHEDDPAVDARLAELRRDAEDCGLRTMVYAGKIKAGCMVPEKVALVSGAGLGTASLCKTTKRDADTHETTEVLCAYYDECPAIRQRENIQNCHIIFTPHSFLSMTLPEELQYVRGIVADERVHHMFLHTTTLSASTLTSPRKPPKLTKRLKEEKVTPEELLADRGRVSEIVVKAMKSGLCPAQAVLNAPLNRPGREAEGALPLVESALTVMRSATQRDMNISPDTSEEDLTEICSRPTGKDVHEELRFWKIVEERIGLLITDRLREEGIKNMKEDIARLTGTCSELSLHRLHRELTKLETTPAAAKGKKDYRIQWLCGDSGAPDGSDLIRISWRSKPNWGDVPFLLLDASAAPDIVEKIWGGGRDRIVVHDVVQDVGRSLNVRIVGIINETMSTSSIIGSDGGSHKKMTDQGKRLDRTRKAISAVSGLYGMGRVVVGTNIALRRTINSGWVCPDNVDWCHFGAMRGLDMFKHHAAALSVGRMEPPTRSIDGLAAALTYDDDTPELPYDSRGDGLDREGEQLKVPTGQQTLRHRSGETLIMAVPRYPGKWAALIQKQYREEELLQFLGRLRPVYRAGEPPVWYAMSSIIPEGVIVDDIIHIKDFLSSRQGNKFAERLWDAIRRTGGVVVPEILHKFCPDLFSSKDHAERIMTRMRFTGNPEEDFRETRGFNIWEWTGLDGSERYAYVRGSVPNQEVYLRESLTRFMIPGSSLKLVRDSVTGLNLLAKPRSPDAVEESIGSREERIQAENADFNSASLRLIEGSTVHTSSSDAEMRFLWGRPDDQGQAYTDFSLSEMKAVVAIERTKREIASKKQLTTDQD